jgi:hypothetical protein
MAKSRQLLAAYKYKERLLSPTGSSLVSRSPSPSYINKTNINNNSSYYPNDVSYFSGRTIVSSPSFAFYFNKHEPLSANTEMNIENEITSRSDKYYYEELPDRYLMNRLVNACKVATSLNNNKQEQNTQESVKCVDRDTAANLNSTSNNDIIIEQSSMYDFPNDSSLISASIDAFTNEADWNAEQVVNNNNNVNNNKDNNNNNNSDSNNNNSDNNNINNDNDNSRQYIAAVNTTSNDHRVIIDCVLINNRDRVVCSNNLNQVNHEEISLSTPRVSTDCCMNYNSKSIEFRKEFDQKLETVAPNLEANSEENIKNDKCMKKGLIQLYDCMFRANPVLLNDTNSLNNNTQVTADTKQDLVNKRSMIESGTCKIDSEFFYNESLVNN